MSDRPTPETDAFSVKFRSVCGSKSWVPTDICRRFERERDKAREDATNYYARIGELEKERDEAREAVAKWESSFDAMERAGAEQARRADENREWALRAERERDEAREALAEAWRFADQWLALADGYLKRINEIQNDIQKN